MRVSFEVKGEDKTTTYTADFEPAEKSFEEVEGLVKEAAGKVGDFLKAKFVRFSKGEE